MTTIHTTTPTTVGTSPDHSISSTSRFRVITSFLQETSIFQRIVATVVVVATAFITIKAYLSQPQTTRVTAATSNEELLKIQYFKMHQELLDIQTKLRRITRECDTKQINIPPAANKLILNLVQKRVEFKKLLIKILQKPVLYKNIKSIQSVIHQLNTLDTFINSTTTESKQARASFMSKFPTQIKSVITQHLELLIDQKDKKITKEEASNTLKHAIAIKEEINKSNIFKAETFKYYLFIIAIFTGQIDAIISAPAADGFPSLDKKHTKQFYDTKKAFDTAQQEIFEMEVAVPQNKATLDQINDKWCQTATKGHQLAEKLLDHGIQVCRL